ncbi:MAG TPA: cupin domain-containing protein [Kouleothrix sp.]|uniref:cupin domain-containing protein n=1 Tax=Kouleothrix sp. TaxID=2779161 RepID=UPI002B73DA17|nr:cupin domain-containing protein [Kouleothrix sp.]HRC76697.1 cupin domain-containing protein [Kouleothrix sp.]
MTTDQPIRWIEMVPGIRRHTIASGAGLMHMQVRLDAGAVMPVHQHPHEQTTYVLSGRLRFRLGEETHELAAGDVLLIPSNTPHGVDALEDTLVLDTFSPPREDLLAQDRTAG